MVMDGGHPENTAPVGDLEKTHLKNHRKGLYHKNSSHQDQQKFMLGHDSNGAQGAP